MGLIYSNKNSPTKRGIEIIYSIYYSKCSIYSQVVHVSNGRGISYTSRIHKKETCGDIFWEVVDIDCSHAWECKTVPGTRGFHSVRSSDNPVFEIWTRKLACFCLPCCDGDWDVCESLDWVDGWDRISLALDQCAIVELTPLEQDQSSISIDFHHVSSLVHLGMMQFLNIFLFFYVVLKITLMDMYHMENI